MKRLFLAMAASLLMALPAPAMVTVDLGTDVPLTNFTSVTGAIPASSTVITLTKSARHLKIKSDTGAAALFFRLDGGVATTANFKIEPGTTLSLEALPGIPNVTIIGASALGNYSILAW